MLMVIRVDRVVTYQEELLPKNSHFPVLTCEVTWEINTLDLYFQRTHLHQTEQGTDTRGS